MSCVGLGSPNQLDQNTLQCCNSYDNFISGLIPDEENVSYQELRVFLLCIGGPPNYPYEIVPRYGWAKFSTVAKDMVDMWVNYDTVNYCAYAIVYLYMLYMFCHIMHALCGE